MSDKDFAQASNVQTESKRASQASNPKPVFVATLGTMLAIVCFSVGYYLGEKYSHEADRGEKYEALLAKLKVQQEENKSLKKETEKLLSQQDSKSDIGELTFYQELPKQSVTPEPLVTQNNLTKPAKTNSKEDRRDSVKLNENQVTTPEEVNLKATEAQLNAIIADELNSPGYKFRIQVASFANKKDAETMAIQLKKIDLESDIKQVTLNNIGIRYRVYTTPFNQHQKAIHAQQQIQQEFGIKGIIITQ